jgi:hypothetical protein
VGPAASEEDVVRAFRAEVGGWTPRQVPNLADLARDGSRHWERPVMLASRFGAVALAVMLLLSAALVLLHPAFPGSDELVERLSGVRP